MIFIDVLRKYLFQMCTLERFNAQQTQVVMHLPQA